MILRRIEPDGAMARLRAAQNGVLNSLLNNARMTRLVEFGAMSNGKGSTYTLSEMLTDLRHGIWSEVAAPSVRIDAFRRNLQYAYLAQLASKINPPAVVQSGPPLPAAFAFFQAPPPDEARALMRTELMDLDAQLRSALPRATDTETRAHITEARHRIDITLHPEK